MHKCTTRKRQRRCGTRARPSAGESAREESEKGEKTRSSATTREQGLCFSFCFAKKSHVSRVGARSMELRARENAKLRFPKAVPRGLGGAGQVGSGQLAPASGPARTRPELKDRGGRLGRQGGGSGLQAPGAVGRRVRGVGGRSPPGVVEKSVPPGVVQ